MDITAQMRSLAYDNDGTMYCVSVSMLRAKSPAEFLQSAKDKLKAYPNIHRVRISYMYNDMIFDVKVERCEMIEDICDIIFKF